jgi:hypothetical protein
MAAGLSPADHTEWAVDLVPISSLPARHEAARIYAEAEMLAAGEGELSAGDDGSACEWLQA